MEVKLVATDIDGTITRDRSSTIIPCEVIECMRLLEARGVLVALVSANALPIVVGLKKYLGLKGPVIGENGALAYFDGSGVESLAKLTARDALEDVIKQYGNYVKSSWQNTFRLYDFALKIRDEWKSQADTVYGMIKDYVESRYEWVKVGFSGYAIHLTPKDVSKGKALLYVAERLGIRKEEIIAVGDSSIDVELIRVAGIGVAVGNADEELKREAKLVVSKPSYEGFIELAKLIINGKLPSL